MIFDILSSFEVLFLFECNRYVRRFQHSREAERRNFLTTEFCTRAIPTSGRRNSNPGASQFRSRGVAIPAVPGSACRNSHSNNFCAGQLRCNDRFYLCCAISAQVDSQSGNSDQFRVRRFQRVAIPP